MKYLLTLLVAGDLYGAAQSGFGNGHGCEQGIPVDAALLATLAAFAVSFAVLYMASTTNMAKRKKRATISDYIMDVMWTGKWMSVPLSGTDI